MTQARRLTVAEGQQAFYHCVARCVRRAWLCGIDPITGVDYEHRKTMIAARIVQLAGIFAVDVYSYAVMSNHLHVVLSIEPAASRDWSDEEVARRWVQLFPAREPEQNAVKIAALCADKAALEARRDRLADLSWFMRCLDEHIARKANAEDDVTGRFWEGRFKSQLLDDEAALAAAMAYVDLNPVRAGIADCIESSDHTSVQMRAEELRKDPGKADEPIQPIAGVRLGLDMLKDKAFARLAMSNRQYIELVDYTGRQLRPGKRGKIDEREPTALSKLGLNTNYWTAHVKGVGSGYWRFVASVEALEAKAAEWKRQWLKGIGYARRLVTG